MTDFKAPARIRDRSVYAEFHALNLSCCACKRIPAFRCEAHHILHRSQGGDDVLANLAPLCRLCHAAEHGNPYTTGGVRITPEFVRAAIAAWIREHDDAETYLIGKLGPGEADDFVQRLERQRLRLCR